MARDQFRRRLVLLVLFTIVIDLVGTALVLLFEHNTALVNNPWEAFFFSTTQLLTVSSQMPLPTTTGGRIVDIVLELYAISVVAAVAGMTSHFLHAHTTELVAQAPPDTAS